MNLEELIQHHSKPELAKLHGMVYQVWEDGEITLQKSGDLLWHRSLHCIAPGITAKAVSVDLFPHHTGAREHGYIFTDQQGAEAVRIAILSAE